MADPVPDFFPAAIVFLLGPNIESNGAAGPTDPGGETKWSVARNRHPEIVETQWAAWTRADSEALLRASYWDKNRCAEMPWRWALTIFSGEVNQGSVIACAQRALGIRVDGVVGPGTLAAMNAATDFHLAAFQRNRAKAYIASSKFSTFGDGWFDRLFLETMAAMRAPC